MFSKISRIGGRKGTSTTPFVAENPLESQGRAKGDGPKVTEPNLRFPAVFCENLRFSAKICGFLRFPAPSKCWKFQEKGYICENLRFSAKICVLGGLCHLSSVTLSSACWTAGRPPSIVPETLGSCFLKFMWPFLPARRRGRRRELTGGPARVQYPSLGSSRLCNV